MGTRYPGFLPAQAEDVVNACAPTALLVTSDPDVPMVAVTAGRSIVKGEIYGSGLEPRREGFAAIESDAQPGSNCPLAGDTRTADRPAAWPPILRYPRKMQEDFGE
jgi:hypothetical protein